MTRGQDGWRHFDSADEETETTALQGLPEGKGVGAARGGGKGVMMEENLT